MRLGSIFSPIINGIRSIVATAANGISAVVGALTSVANREVTEEKYLWISVLDGRTSPICISLANRVFVVGKGPLPPMHGHCRSKVAPIAADVDVSTLQTADQWLRSLSFEDLSAALKSKRRAKLYQENVLSISRILDVDREFITIKDLVKRYGEPDL